jgi:ABC-type uncharacterized transport system ATPase subunit
MIDLFALESFPHTPVMQLSLGQSIQRNFTAAMLHVNSRAITQIIYLNEL